VNRLLAGGALAILIAAMAVIALSSVGSKSSGTQTTTAASTKKPVTRPQPPKPPPRPARIKLVALGPYDPDGDGTENDAEVKNAVDGNASTFWSTEHYTHGFFKPGVGIVLDAGKKRPVTRVLVGTDDAGSRAEIQLGNHPTGPYRVVSAEKALQPGTTGFPLKRGASGRYVLVWLTALPSTTGEGHITEVRAIGS
jgi:eukaryotic-like serine/threonine-protein kinase